MRFIFPAAVYMLHALFSRHGHKQRSLTLPGTAAPDGLTVTTTFKLAAPMANEQALEKHGSSAAAANESSCTNALPVYTGPTGTHFVISKSTECTLIGFVVLLLPLSETAGGPTALCQLLALLQLLGVPPLSQSVTAEVSYKELASWDEMAQRVADALLMAQRWCC
jgi:hypothetical protein